MLEEKFRILFIEECDTGFVAWLHMDDAEDNEDMFLKIGEFVAKSMMLISRACMKKGISPCMHIIPRKLDTDQFTALKNQTEQTLQAAEENIEDDNFSLELEELMSDVQRNNRS